MNEVVTPQAVAANTPRRWLRVCLWSLLGLALTITLALVAFTAVMARVPAYRAQMQGWLSERAQLDIRFDALSAGWRGYGPELRFTNATIRSRDGQRVLAVAERGSAAFDGWQALRTGRLASLRLGLDGTSFKLQRLEDGRFEVIGQSDWPEFRSERAFRLDSLPVGRLVIRRVKLSFRDLKTGRGPWELPDVSLDITRDTSHVELQGMAELQPSLGKALQFSAVAKGNLDMPGQLQWSAQVEGTQFDLAGWKQVMPDDWPAPVRGTGSFRFEAALVGAAAQRFSGRINFVDVSLQLPAWRIPLPQADPLQQRDEQGQPLPAPVNRVTAADTSAPVMTAAAQDSVYRNLSLQFSAERGDPQGKVAGNEEDWTLRFDNLQLSRESTPWPASTASLRLQFQTTDAANATPTLTAAQVTAQHLVLDNLWPLLAYLPQNDTTARVRALYGTGEIRNLAVNWQRTEGEPRIGMRADFAKVGIAPVLRTPGFSGVSGSLSGTGARGELRLDSSDVTVSLPRMFRTPLPLDRVTGAVNWERSMDGLRLSSNDLQVANENGRVEAQGSIWKPREGVAQADVRATGLDLQAAATPRYLPAGVMTPKTLAWMDEAFPAGVVQRADMILKGPLQGFPWRNGEGDFTINARIADLTLNYQSGWMPATGLQVEAEFHNAGLKAMASAGRVNGLSLQRAAGSIRDYRDAEVRVQARARGDLQQGLAFVQQSPVGPKVGDLFMRLSGAGALQADADLYLPLKNFSRRKIDIDVGLRDARVSMAGYNQSADQLAGTLHIANEAVTDAALSGRFLQGRFTTRAEAQGPGRYNIIATGQAAAQPLAQFLKLPAWVRLDGAAEFRYTMPGYAQRDANGVRRLYSVDSDLRGLSINLPAPVNKPAPLARALHLDVDMGSADSNTERKWMQLRGSLGDLRALVRWRDRNNEWQFDRGGLRADAVTAALPAHEGLRIEGRIASVEMDQWLRVGDGLPVATGTAPSGSVQDVLRAANVNIGKFYLFGFEWPQVRAVAQATDAGWRVDVAGEQASGQVRVPYVLTGNQPLQVNMDELWLTPREGTGASNGATGNSSTGFDPRSLPAIRASIGHFRFGEHDFGALQLTGNRVAQGLQVESLRISGASFNGTGKGSWLQAANGQLNQLDLVIDSTDVRATLQQFNYGDFIAARRGKLQANLQWPGGLDETLPGRASGSLEVTVEDGQLLNVEPGAGRVLGLLSVAALPRRLGLDFRDVTDKGLAFDRIHADFTVTNGDARTQNLLLRGPTAEIGIAGRLGLGARDYDQTAVVTGDVSGAITGASVVAGGPVVGAAVLLFSQLFKEPLKGVARAYYHIGGSWDEPKVERIDADAGKASMSESQP